MNLDYIAYLILFVFAAFGFIPMIGSACNHSCSGYKSDFLVGWTIVFVLGFIAGCFFAFVWAMARVTS